MTQAVFRTAVLAWVVLLVAGLSLSGQPILGSVGWVARNVLKAVSVRSGQAVFKNSVDERKIVAHCVYVWGIDEQGESHQLYWPDCPREGTQFGTDYVDVAIQRIVRWIPVGDLRNDRRYVSRATPTKVRRLAALGDYFCHSPLASDVPMVEVLIAQQRITRNITDGQITSRPPYVCSFDCRPDRPKLVAPRCDLGSRPGDGEESVE